MSPLIHPLVVDAAGGGACPVQYEGVLIDGRHFYFRYRGGYAQLGVGATPDDAVDDTMLSTSAGVAHGEDWQGVFATDADRDRVFATLLTMRLATDFDEPRG